MFKQHTMSILLVLLTVGTSVIAQPTTAPAGPDTELITRVYEITDLQLQKRDYPAPARAEAREGSMRGGGGQDLFGGGPAPTSQPSASDVTSSIIGLMQDTVASDTWKDNGGTIGSIRAMNGVLVITQTAQNH